MKIRVFYARQALLAAALCASNLTFSQAPNVVVLPETVVTATRNTQLQSATLPHTTVITREEIERSQATDLNTLLQREAGLQRTQNGGIGTVSSVFIRGAASLQTLVLIDGVPQNKQDASGAVSLEHVMLDNVERVEIVRGNVSAIYGSGAVGGVIQIFTRTGRAEPKFKLFSELGSRNTRKLGASFSGGVGDTAIAGGVSRFSTDGFSAVDTTRFADANPDADSYKNTSGHLSLSHKLAADHQLGLKLSRTTGNTLYDNAYGARTDSQSSTTRLNQATLFSDNRWGIWRSRISISDQSDKSESRDNGFFGSDDSFATRARIVNWVNTIALSGDWLATAGLEQQRQRIATTTTSSFNAVYDVARTTTAAFGGVEGKLAGGDVQLNARHDKVGDLAQTTGYAGYGYPISQQLKLIGSVSTAFNAPPLGYLFAPGFGNAGLRAERARSRELGLQYESAGQLLRTTYFDTRVTDQLGFDNTSNTFVNIGRTRNRGLELSYKASFGATDLRSSLTLQNPVDEIAAQPLVRRARTLFSSGVSHTAGRWRFGADLQFSGKRRDAYADPVTFAAVDTTLAAYTVADVSLAYRLSPQVQLTARIDNVSDKRYQSVYGFQQQPRSAYVGLTWAPSF